MRQLHQDRKKICVPHSYEKRYKLYPVNWFRYSLLPTPYSLLPTPFPR
ncbi:hypothetical protein BJP36_43825 [Moorena producens JHB]|uniref:Uncharacterized protein n=1 Tax=Moorena producens (strain JHB) TaxID=1454205 RepID=A0A9Q9UVX5_MOOP1|nr:hypothetical protein [Moorena producens]WAN69291.1 hypothetical protein BJP36_43825 [Moorena producens JHB]